MAKLVDNDAGGFSVTAFVCSGSQVVAEYGGGQPVSTPLRKYVYGTYIDEPVVMVDRTAAGSRVPSSEELFYYHRNNLYSVAALTDKNGAVVERYAYDAYGGVTFLTPG